MYNMYKMYESIDMMNDLLSKEYIRMYTFLSWLVIVCFIDFLTADYSVKRRVSTPEIISNNIHHMPGFKLS